MPGPRRPLPPALTLLAVVLGVLAVVGAALAAAGFANQALPDVVRGGSLALVAAVCLVIVLVRGRRAPRR